MKIGKAHLRGSYWINFHWEFIWLSFTIDFKSWVWLFGHSWHTCNYKGKSNTDVRFSFLCMRVTLEIFSKNYWDTMHKE